MTNYDSYQGYEHNYRRFIAVVEHGNRRVRIEIQAESRDEAASIALNTVPYETARIIHLSEVQRES